MKRTHVKIYGDVQGVGFRALTEHRAKKLSVTGWVKNNIDGTVEAIFEGEDESVSDMVEWCKKGPPTSYVEKVDVDEEEFSGEFENFQIVE